ncbi:MAG TPA: sugar phosphate nucleotidyltransferase, partial [Tepidisphaeraceae bacterium]|nr:sugar phosphate nucleotidyltransferase [Tepidisphaeraceae bacterium]
VCTLEAHRAAVLNELPELSPENLLGEPMGRDTSNAVGLSAAVLAARDPDAVFAITTADHVIEPMERFQKCLKAGFESVAKHPNTLVTFGVTPTFGHTGLGYIERGDALAGIDGAFKVTAFREKPDKPTADRYVESRRYFWNSGMFVWKASTILSRLKEYLPKSYEGLQIIAKAWDTGTRDETLKKVYPILQKISIDFAVMEPASARAPEAGAPSGVVVVEMPISWLDVGSWPQLSETLNIDDSNNAVEASRLVMIDSDNNIIVAREEGHLLTLIGVSDMVIVHTKDATLICPKNEAQRVKDIVAKVKEAHGAGYI